MPYKDRSKQLEAQRRHYRKKKAYYKERAKKRRKEIAEWFYSFKASLKCIKCDESHPACLDFHHRESDKKEYAIHQIATQGWSKAAILKEIEKCDVVCANCHRKIHYRGVEQSGSSSGS